MSDSHSLILSLILKSSDAQSSISVKVSDGKTQKDFIVTNPKGRLTVPDLPMGTYEVTVGAPGFESQTRMVDLAASKGGETFVLGREGAKYFYRGRAKVPFDLERRILGFAVSPQAVEEIDEGAKAEMMGGIAARLGAEIDEKMSPSSDPDVRVVSFPKRMSKAAVRDALEKAREDPMVDQAGAVVVMTDEAVSFLTSKATVRFADGVTADQAKEIVEGAGWALGRQMRTLGNVWRLRTDAVEDYDLLDGLNTLAERDEVIYAEPVLRSSVVDDAFTPTDYLFPEQWDHQLIGTPNAWEHLRNINTDLTFGSSDVIIAIVDSGVDGTHPEFNGTVTSGASKMYTSFDFVNMVANNNSITADHGTACASAAAASANNGSAIAGINEGVAGPAGNARVIGIRRGGDEQLYSDFYLWAGGLDPESETDDFPAVINPGADIISSSFGFSTGAPISGLMQDTFDALTDQGRDGKGCLLFFSAANNNNDLDVSFDRPWGMYERCFSVAASTLANDGISEVRSGYSNFGSVIEFAAPSNNVLGTFHNPTNRYGAFAATTLGDATNQTNNPTVGRPTNQTTLSNAENAGATVLNVNSTAGMAAGQALIIGTPGQAQMRNHRVQAVNGGANTVTVTPALYMNYASGTDVITTGRDYQSDFGGTSYATPVCAGVAGLMISMNPDLTWEQVRDILRETAVKIDPTNTNATGRWVDEMGRNSADPDYTGPFFSEFYGYGRIDADAAVERAGWTIDLITPTLSFIDVPEGETAMRAVRFDVRSAMAATFEVSVNPAAPFSMESGTQIIPADGDYDTVHEVYLWVRFTGQSPGSNHTGSLTVRNPETDMEWVIPISANSIARPTSAVMLSLDRSGSMTQPSGVGSNARIDVLRYSADVLIDVLHEGDACGIVAFDADPDDVQIPVVGPLGPPDVFDMDRSTLRSAITTFNPTPGGNTAIGDGLERAQTRLDPVAGYDNKAVIVMTDGKETASKYIADVSGSITDRTFAVGLGRAENINPAALNSITNGTGGYTLLTDDLNTDSRFKLAKYFLQILAGVKNEDVVVDPDGFVKPGALQRIPFVLNEADISVDVIFMATYPNLVTFELETPAGEIIALGNAAPLGGAFVAGQHARYYRMRLPVPLGAGAHAGKWHARLSIDEKAYRRFLNEVFEKSSTTAASVAPQISPDLRMLATHGVQYTLLTHSWSNLRMEADVYQASHEPGAELELHAKLSEYTVPVEDRARVAAIVTDPGGAVHNVPLAETGQGRFAARFKTVAPGTYTLRYKAQGKTLRGNPFTREQVRTGNVWKGGDAPFPTTPETTMPTKDQGPDICDIAQCLLDRDILGERAEEQFKEWGIDLEALRKCIAELCEDGGKRPARLAFPLAQASTIMPLLERLSTELTNLRR